MKKRTILVVGILFFALGFVLAHRQGKATNQGVSFLLSNILPHDHILLVNHGDIFLLTPASSTQITHNQNLIEPVKIGNTFLAVLKTTNYSSLLLFDQTGNSTQTVFDGNSSNIDTMDWASDPALSTDQTTIAYVSDKDKAQTNVPDNALYVLHLASGISSLIARPDPYSGGITHPVFNPADPNIILYDYYQYDPQTLTPYSTIEEYTKDTQITTPLTFEDKNAYQASFSPDGKQLVFLGRNGDANSVTMYVADFTSSGLANIHALASGDFAYPVFSTTRNHIYYLFATGNNGYDLMSATIKNNKLTLITPIVVGSQLLGNSSFEVY